MKLWEADRRIIRIDAKGQKFEYSDSTSKPPGEGWQRVNPVEHPRARVFLWFRPYHFVSKDRTDLKREPLNKVPLVQPGLLKQLGVGLENIVADWRDKLRAGIANYASPFLTGDRVRLKGDSAVYYVKGYDRSSGTVHIVSSIDKEDERKVTNDKLEKHGEHVPMFFDFGDNVTLAKGSVDKRKAVDAQIIGFDNAQNKFRVSIGGIETLVYPEAVVGLRAKEGEDLVNLEKKLISRPDLWNKPDEKAYIEALIRASRDKRQQISVEELAQDVAATHGIPLSLGNAAVMMSVLPQTIPSMFFNPITKTLDISGANLGLRMVGNHRDLKVKKTSFGWKNITTDDADETFAHENQRVLLPKGVKSKTGADIGDARLVRIKGVKCTVQLPTGEMKDLAMGDLKSADGKQLTPDPADPAAFGSVNRSTFWMLRDREWVKDFQPGDVATLMGTAIRDLAGRRVRDQILTVVDTTTDGRVIVKGAGGMKFSLSPRQLNRRKSISSLKQFHDRVTYDPQANYGGTYDIGDMATLNVGMDKRQKFLELRFENGKKYKDAESDFLIGVSDPIATDGMRRSINPVSGPDNKRLQQTIAPSKTLFDAIRKLYPTARTLTIQRFIPFQGESPEGGFKRPGEAPGVSFDPYLGIPGAHKSDVQYRMDAQGQLQTTGSLSAVKWQDFNPFSRMSRQDFATTYSDVRDFSISDIEGAYERTPVRVRILVDADPKKLKGLHTTFKIDRLANMFHQMEFPEDAQKHSIANTLTGMFWRDPQAPIPTTAVEWDKSVRVRLDGDKLTVELGSEARKITSSRYPPNAKGKAPTLADISQMGVMEKYEQWEKAFGNKDALTKKIYNSSLFTFDPIHKRFVASASRYNEVMAFLRDFYGPEYFKEGVYEDVDGATCYLAEAGKLKSEIDMFQKTDADLEKIHNNAEIPALVDSTNPSNQFGFRDRDMMTHQKESMNFLLSTPHALLANDQGTGKTATILGSIVARFNAGESQKALIIAPAQLVDTTWPEEIETWCKSQEKRDKIAAIADKKGFATKAERNKFINAEWAKLPPDFEYMKLKAASSGARERIFDELYSNPNVKVVVASYEMVNNYYKELKLAGFDTVVLDEAQKIKTGTTKAREGSIRGEVIKDAFGDAKFKIASTGTPIENEPLDLHSIMEWLNPSILGPADQFLNDFVDIDYVKKASGGAVPVNIAIKKADELARRLGPVMHRVDKDDLREKESREIYADMVAKGISADYNPSIHYGAVPPRDVLPSFTLDSGGELIYEAPKPGLRDNLAAPIDLDQADPKYGAYRGLLKKASDVLADRYASQSIMTFKPKPFEKGSMAALAKLNRMQQAANDPTLLAGVPEFSRFREFQEYVPNPKFDKLMEIIQTHDRKPMDFHAVRSFSPSNYLSKKQYQDTRGKKIIFCEHVGTMKMLRDRLEKAGYGDRILTYAGTQHIRKLNPGMAGSGKQVQQKIIDMFQNADDQRDILIANDAAQTGLNLPQADIVVNYDFSWNPQAMAQRIDRAHRVRKQPRPVKAYNIVVKGTVEEEKLRKHAFKKMIFDKMIGKTTEVPQFTPETFKSLDNESMAERLLGITEEQRKQHKELIKRNREVLARRRRAKQGNIVKRLTWFF